jgi:hypothetical protein
MVPRVSVLKRGKATNPDAPEPTNASKTKEYRMAPNPPRIFSGITPDQYAQLTQKARANGIEMSGNSGTATKFGVEMAWTYAPELQQLTVQCLRTPLFISAASVYAKLEALAQQHKSQA